MEQVRKFWGKGGGFRKIPQNCKRKNLSKRGREVTGLWGEKDQMKTAKSEEKKTAGHIKYARQRYALQREKQNKWIDFGPPLSQGLRVWGSGCSRVGGGVFSSRGGGRLTFEV